VALTAAQLADARRYAGYWLAGTTQVTDDNNDTVYMRFGMVTMSLHRRLTTLSASEEAIMGTYLTTLGTLETAIVGAADNLDTDQAAVWHRNRSEVTDRARLFDEWRRRMCQFIGITPGPGLGLGGAAVSISRA